MVNSALIHNLAIRLKAFESEAHTILGIHEEAPSRVVLLDASYSKLIGLSLAQDDLFRQALRCIESRLFRAAHVMAWAAFMDFFEHKLAEDGLKKIKAQYPNWNTKSVEDLRETVVEYQLIEASRKIGLCSKTEMKALHGLLNKRNECAHPSNYFPGYNEALGYLSELLQRIEAFMKKTV